jgi:hypothetical protein
MSLDFQQDIATRLARNIPSVAWEQAWVEGEVEASSSELEFAFKTKSKEENWIVPDFDDTDAISKKLFVIRQSMTLPGQKPWSKCKFTLFPDGTFKFDVEYDD